MPEVSTYAPGAFCWVELATSDPEGAKSFYGKIMGWTVKEHPMGDHGVYNMMQLNGKDVGGMYALMEEQKAKNVPPHWLCYISVEDTDATTNKAESLGAEVLMAPMDVMDIGRMSVLQDPTGAVFAVWQAKKSSGTGVTSEPGATCWFELMTSDVPAAKKFYSELFGYGLQDQSMMMPYTFLKLNDVPQAGLMAIPPEAGPMPSNWMIYFAVADCDATVEEVKSIGGNLLAGPMDIPMVGRFAALKDAQGAAFSVIKLENS